MSKEFQEYQKKKKKKICKLDVLQIVSNDIVKLVDGLEVIYIWIYNIYIQYDDGKGLLENIYAIEL